MMVLKVKQITKIGALALTVLLASFVIVACGKKAAPKSADANWEHFGNDLSNTRYSLLDQINDKNVKELTVAWQKDLEVKEAYEGTPIVVDGVMYVTTPLGPKLVYAFDAKTGQELWKTDLNVPQDYKQYACCGLVSRGASYHNGKVFVGRLDGKLTALDAKIGKELWTVTVIDYKEGAVITSPPLIVAKHNLAIIGHGGGEYGAKSRITAYDMDKGTQKWIFYTIPEDDEAITKTWKGDSYKVGGAATWLVGSYDEQADMVFWGTSNPTPWNATLRGDDPLPDGTIKHTNLYSSTTLALDAASGKLKWHFQKTPFDAWDYDGVNEKMLATIKINGADTKVVMEADRNGFFFVNDRATGKLISADKFVKANWAKYFDVEKGMPVEDPEFRNTTKRKVLPDDGRASPSFVGGKNWNPMSYNPNTGLVYIPANNLSTTFEISDAKYNKGHFYIGAGWDIKGDEGKSPGEVIAWDPVNKKKVWSISLEHPMPGGTITTKGNLLFFGDLTGRFNAYNATTGEKLWEYKTESGIVAGPSTYEVDGVQYVEVLEGRPEVIMGLMGGVLSGKAINATPRGGKLNVFALAKK